MAEFYSVEKTSLDLLLETANALFSKLRGSPLWGLLEDEPMIQGFMKTLQSVEAQIKAPRPVEVKPSIPVIWTDQSKTTRCLWQEAHGRCIYEQGKHEHKEEGPHGKDEI